MIIDRKYIVELYNKIGENEKEDLEINSLKDFIDYIEETISGNLQYDFNIEINNERLFNKIEKQK